jgi:DNA-binding CsgD family transcriptional regulator
MLMKDGTRIKGVSKSAMSEGWGDPRILHSGSSPLAAGTKKGAKGSDSNGTEMPDQGVLGDDLASLPSDFVLVSRHTLEEMVKRSQHGLDSADRLGWALADLPNRQAEVVQLLSKGLRNQEIANVLGLSSRTVKATLSALYIRYDVTNRTELLGRLIEESSPLAADTAGGRASAGSTVKRLRRTSDQVNPRLRYAV